MKLILIAIIKVYQKYVSGITMPSCRYYPSCSEYTIEALEKYGIYRGSLLALKRIAKCHPFSPGGYDPVK
ncbi:membrane protein insertion efficiency factor YidD [Candidatus Oleimmundimicrobium sp.]|uniref:membrane protein insertion efficiency factor YidD n=1 Tax=Candidatus Oleimmundimicrobium sp. TaxID=3060597 RepID=UPI00271B546B|nr:membrane protein insertion efficiency factor YidD [Candidatus Oleimmundimicrobium sp.]MDO8886385.1 membrane protein insertion efficiency factor YidD [Candidatus Oleimmundimicrobium sp.]